MLYPEVVAVLPLLKEEQYPELLSQEVKENQFLKIKTQTGRERAIGEIKKRAQTVTPAFWHFFEALEEKEQRLALFYLILKAYPLAMDFHFEVVLKKWRAMEDQLDRYDLQMRLDEIASQEEEVAQWTDSTRTKLLTVFIRMLREAGLMEKDRLKKPEGVAPSFWEYFMAAGVPWFLEACFLSKAEREAYV